MGGHVLENALAPTVASSAVTEWMLTDDPKGRATREAMPRPIPLKAASPIRKTSSAP